jgi:ATP-binding cassette, subfamily G (WHITE), member 2, PDR
LVKLSALSLLLKLLVHNCPPRQTTANFLTSLTNSGEYQPCPGFEGKVPCTANKFVRVWHDSKDHMQLLKEIGEFDHEFPEDSEHLQKFWQARKMIQAKGSHSLYTISTPMQIQLCLWHGFQHFIADRSTFISAVIGKG